MAGIYQEQVRMLEKCLEDYHRRRMLDAKISDRKQKWDAIIQNGKRLSKALSDCSQQIRSIEENKIYEILRDKSFDIDMSLTQEQTSIEQIDKEVAAVADSIPKILSANNY